MIGIYKIVNKINGKVYIGQSQNVEERWKEHTITSKNGNNVIYRAIRKYGVENFSFEVIEECSIDELNEREIHYIKEFNSCIFSKNSNGYNMTLGGDGTRGYVLSKNTKKKISEAQKGEKSAWYGKKHSKETIEKMSQTRKFKFSGENCPMFGREVSEKTRKKLSEANKGRFVSEEIRKKISEGNKGKFVSEETRKKLSKYKKTAKKVICEGRVFISGKECANFYGVKESTFRGWLNSSYDMPKEWYDKGLSYLDDVGQEKNIAKGICGGNNPRAKKVICDGIVYECAKECAKFYDVNYQTMNGWLKGNRKMKQEFINKGLKYL